MDRVGTGLPNQDGDFGLYPDQEAEGTTDTELKSQNLCARHAEANEDLGDKQPDEVREWA